jgi:hypothetical protein
MSHLMALGGGGTAVARGNRITLRQVGTIHHISIDAEVTWLKLSHDGRRLLIYADNGKKVWHWSERHGLEMVALVERQRDIAGFGFIEGDAGAVFVVAREGSLQGFAENGNLLFVCNLRSPCAFEARDFVNLPAGRVAIWGHVFSDSLDSVVTVELAAILGGDSGAFQRAYREAAPPVRDRAVRLAIGPTAHGEAVVYRDPEEEELPETEEDLEDMGDVDGFTGLYLRQIASGRLISRTPGRRAIASGARIAVSNGVAAVEVPGGIDVVTLATGGTRHIAAIAAAVDPSNLQVAWLDSGDVVTISSIADIRM